MSATVTVNGEVHTLRGSAALFKWKSIFGLFVQYDQAGENCQYYYIDKNCKPAEGGGSPECIYKAVDPPIPAGFGPRHIGRDTNYSSQADFAKFRALQNMATFVQRYPPYFLMGGFQDQKMDQATGAKCWRSYGTYVNERGETIQHPVFIHHEFYKYNNEGFAAGQMVRFCISLRSTNVNWENAEDGSEIVKEVDLGLSSSNISSIKSWTLASVSPLGTHAIILHHQEAYSFSGWARPCLTLQEILRFLFTINLKETRNEETGNLEIEILSSSEVDMAVSASTIAGRSTQDIVIKGKYTQGTIGTAVPNVIYTVRGIEYNQDQHYICGTDCTHYPYPIVYSHFDRQFHIDASDHTRSEYPWTGTYNTDILYFVPGGRTNVNFLCWGRSANTPTKILETFTTLLGAFYDKSGVFNWVYRFSRVTTDINHGSTEMTPPVGKIGANYTRNYHYSGLPADPELIGISYSNQVLVEPNEITYSVNYGSGSCSVETITSIRVGSSNRILQEYEISTDSVTISQPAYSVHHKYFLQYLEPDPNSPCGIGEIAREDTPLGSLFAGRNKTVPMLVHTISTSGRAGAKVSAPLSTNFDMPDNFPTSIPTMLDISEIEARTDYRYGTHGSFEDPNERYLGHIVIEQVCAHYKHRIGGLNSTATCKSWLVWQGHAGYQRSPSTYYVDFGWAWDVFGHYYSDATEGNKWGEWNIDFHGSCGVFSLTYYEGLYDGVDQYLYRSKILTEDGAVGEPSYYKCGRNMSMMPQEDTSPGAIFDDEGSFEWSQWGTMLADCASYNPILKTVVYLSKTPISWSGIWKDKKCWPHDEAKCESPSLVSFMPDGPTEVGGKALIAYIEPE